MSGATSARDPGDLTAALLASVHHAFFILGHGRKALCVSAAFCDLSGYSAEQFLALPNTRVVNEPDDTPNASRALNQALAGEPAIQRSRDLVRNDGSLVPVESSAKLLPVQGSSPLLLIEFWPRDGELRPERQPGRAGIAASVRDMERDIEPSDLLVGLLASLSHACFAVSQARNLLLITDALCELTGYGRETIEGFRSAELPFAEPDGRPEIQRALQGALAGSPPHRRPREIVRAGGDRVPIESSATLMPVDGGSPLILVEFWPVAQAGEATDAA